jgi:LDH2 family malate/lactate/ureidoglycolate dehydrogenase
MARPATKEVKLRSGFYIEVRQKGAPKGIKIRRDTYPEIQRAIKQYENAYSVHYIGEVRKGKIQPAKSK